MNLLHRMRQIHCLDSTLVVDQVDTSERHQSAPRRGIAGHVDVHVVVGPVALLVVVQRVRRLGEAVSATWSR